jgi:hypothetical protein
MSQWSDDGNEDGEVRREPLIIPSYASPTSKHQNSLKGYTGCMPLLAYDEEQDHSPVKRIMIRGYSGYLNKTKNVVGVPLIPGIDVQMKKTYGASTDNSTKHSGGRFAGHVENHVEQSTLGSSFTNFRSYGKNMDLIERYDIAINKLKHRGQTQDMLLRIVQSKLSERVRSYSQQQVRFRKIFEYFDLDGSNDLDEHEFRQFLELSNVYFDEIQSLALFAYFDKDKTGGISWENFEAQAMVANPQGGSAVIPKGITAPMGADDWKSAGKNNNIKK